MYNTQQDIGNFKDSCIRLLTDSYENREENFLSLLRTIRNSDFIYAAVTYATRDFNGAKTEQLYTRRYPAAGVERRALDLPESPKELVAFVCYLFHGIETGEITLDDFILLYFRCEGSAYDSFLLFCGAVIEPFMSAMLRLCSEFLKKSYHPERDLAKLNHSRNANVLREILDLLEQEFYRTSDYDFVSESERDHVILMLDQMNKATINDDESCLRALIVGYGYFLTVLNERSEIMEAIIDLLPNLH